MTEDGGAKKKKRCPHCGASMMEYRHGLSKALVAGLVRLFKAGKPINIKNLGLTRNMWDNFQKLRYFDLVQKWHDEKGGRKGGMWVITQRGKDFVVGKIKVAKNVWTYRGERVRYEEEEVSIDQVDEGYKYRMDYADEAKPSGTHGKGDQMKLW